MQFKNMALILCSVQIINAFKESKKPYSTFKKLNNLLQSKAGKLNINNDFLFKPSEMLKYIKDKCYNSLPN